MKNILRGRIWRISDPPFLVMDEATSSVDAKTEDLLQISAKCTPVGATS
jgi:ABC-type multidrug transport system fused ATPase/permease subunit